MIAEIGINHNGEISNALQLIESAAAAGADAVKFQTYEAESLVNKGVRLANYQARSETLATDQLSMLKRMQLTHPEHQQLQDFSNQCGVEFMSTAFDSASLAFLTQEMRPKRLKIGSGEITNGPFLHEHAKIGLPILLSTGMASQKEIDEALGVIGFGLVGINDINREQLTNAWKIPSVIQALKQYVTLLQCTTQYPAPVHEANLRVLELFRERYGVRVGFSDHTMGTTAAIVSVAMGASVIEKHLTLDRSLPGPDHKASLLPQEFANMVQVIREAETALGRRCKEIQYSEKENLEIARKSLFASKRILAGERLSSDNVEIKRPGSGCSPMLYWDILGTITEKSIEEGDPINE